MGWKRAAKVALPAVWTFAALFAVEQAANYYYLADIPAVFFTISGWRLPLFILIAVVGSVGAGALLRSLWSSLLSELVGLLLAFLTFYSLCDPRVCFSSGADGLEPLRMGFFLACVMVSGAALGMSARGTSLTKRGQLLVSYCAFGAVAYYPVVFTFAGTRILWDLHPWATLAVLAAAAFSVSAGLTSKVGKTQGLLTPSAAILALVVLALGIASAYLATLASMILLMGLVTAIASASGMTLAGSGRGTRVGLQKVISAAYALGLVLVLLTMLIAVPDAVSGVVPQPGSQTSFAMGTPVYAGAYMDSPAGHASGAGVTIRFDNASAAAIQEDNFVSAGIGIHAAGCCVDGIDYSYRFDVYLFHNGNESLAASAWEVCDDNAACGGHSWKSLMFVQTGWLGQSEVGDNITLRVAWSASHDGEVDWNYVVAGGSQIRFTSFNAPQAENRIFNTGLLEGGTLGPQQTGSYFFQFGIMSGYPIGHGGWKVELACPEILTTGWNCVDHARTLQGDQSFWKVFWRWGEDYPDVSVSAGSSRRITLEYGPSSTPSFESLW